MFGKKSLKIKIAELETETESLMNERHSLKKEVEDLRLKRKIEDEDIKHMIKLKEERLELKNQRFEVEKERESEAAIAVVKDEYRDKLELRLELEVVNIKEMYGEILQRLPNVNVELTKKIK